MDFRATTAGVRPLLPAEMRATVQLYLDGVIDQWFSPHMAEGELLDHVATADEAGRQAPDRGGGANATIIGRRKWHGPLPIRPAFDTVAWPHIAETLPYCSFTHLA
jgi:hypothetical protein